MCHNVPIGPFTDQAKMLKDFLEGRSGWSRVLATGALRTKRHLCWLHRFLLGYTDIERGHKWHSV